MPYELCLLNAQKEVSCIKAVGTPTNKKYIQYAIKAIDK
tara:strand:+ start:1008 stop:1124 length:117 start_codon:yes stop_codon:yes gene_type:complete